MSDTPHNIQTTSFDIHQKLKAAGSELSYFMPVSSHNENATYVLFTSLFDVPEYQIYERNEFGFVLVDFFNTYEEACAHAKEILDKSPKLKDSVCFSNK
ncbi:hypothetical protein J1782_08625 [Rahnella sp. BCC 1045]|uniref:hypothetical protein n=1 Tax=Rahnella sp. BCC 1045 TaxID=2816251 RepID=UPI001C2697CE|nr:hypothetical protein [Rahnella sp. BCC 1045]MBU9819951.1 hypothetical protein [Rahnella sp. BCC 1045]